ncbi:hypothetical protein GCK72_001652 [Caenorhabditis remanei]|uniref:Uncharacterized protein n=1 Tax=Caenorhabditis remanei TaxID=31234 RepID=A0A6A5HQB0_CAERE|nr:hypothetical protein GCK72_001652 [Caenorhabditis remanei]KAF1769835.1 hypothetical protein GCK72_001652 [Caenorhabditis remanei]
MVWDNFLGSFRKIAGRLTSTEEETLQEWYLGKLCATRKEFCGSGRKALQVTCEKTGYKEAQCRGIVDQVISKFCEDNKDTEVCKNESPEKGITGGSLADAVTKAAATTKGNMNMMLIGGVVAVILFLVIGVGLYFFCINSSSPPPPPAAAANTRSTQSAPKKRRKKHRKKKTKKETTSGAESTTKSPVSKAKKPEDIV